MILYNNLMILITILVIILIENVKIYYQIHFLSRFYINKVFISTFHSHYFKKFVNSHNESDLVNIQYNFKYMFI